MDFAAIPRVLIKHNDKVVPMTTIMTEGEFIFALGLHFGKENIRANKAVIVVGERINVDQGKEVLKIPLNLLLQNRISHAEPLTLEFVDPPQAEEGEQVQPSVSGVNNSSKTRNTSKKSCSDDPDEAQGGITRSAAEMRRAAKLKKGRVMSKKKDANGDIITSVGQNEDELLTPLEKKEVRKFVLWNWELDEVTGVPLIYTEQTDTARVELSFIEMQQSPILRGRPYGALKRYAQKWVWEQSNKGEPLKRGLDILDLKAEGYELSNGIATKKPGSHGQSPKKPAPEFDHGKARKPFTNLALKARAAKASASNKPKKQQRKGRGEIVTKNPTAKIKADQEKKESLDERKKRIAAGKRAVDGKDKTQPGAPPSPCDTNGGDGDQSRSLLPSRKRKKTEKVAENEARAAEKGESAQKPPKVTKKAQEAERKRVARKVQEADVAEALTELGRGSTNTSPPSREDDVITWLDNTFDSMADVFTFEGLLQSAPRRFSEDDILDTLNDCGKASLVQGCWVKARNFREAGSDLQASAKEIAVLGYLREYFLGLFAEWRWITEDKIMEIDAEKEAFQGIADFTEDEGPAWEFALPTDLKFLKSHEEIASEHEARWARARNASRVLVESQVGLKNGGDSKAEADAAGKNAKKSRRGKGRARN